MKNYIQLLFVTLATFHSPLGVGGQTISPDKNAVVHSKLRVETTNEADASDPTKAIITINYLDGLGRGLQSVGYQQSPNQKDIITGATNYDKYGRPIFSALPSPATTGSGSYQNNPIALGQSFYGDNRPYSSVSVYENSTLSREREVLGAGQAWATNNKKSQIFYETAGSDVRLYKLDASNNIIKNVFFPSNSLFKKRIIDEQGHTSIEITDKQGRIIQKQQQDQNGYITTYYIYDGLNRMRAVIQPEGYELNQSINYNSTEWNKWIYYYLYDNRGRLIEKKVPSADLEYMVYDKWDRLVWQQTAQQKQFGLWTFKKYDNFNRLIMSGEKTESRDRATLQTESNAWTGDRYESRVTNGVFYSFSNSYPQISTTADIREVFFYDNYTDWLPSGMAFDNINAFHSQHPLFKGMATGSMKRNSENNNWLFTALYYDNKSRIIQTFAQNLHNQIERTDLEYNFIGDFLQSKSSHKYQTNTVTFTEQTQNELDHVGRVKKLLFGINSLPIELVRNTYDEVGRTTQKKILPNDNFTVGGTKNYITRPTIDGTVSQSNTFDLARKAIILLPTSDIKAINLNSYKAEINANAPQGITIQGLQTIDFSHHIRGGLRGINLDNAGNPIPKASEGDLFSYKLDYETAGFYDGNIGKQTWQNVTNNSPIGQRSYTYLYDESSRLKSASFTGLSSENFSMPNLSYDKNGNITNLQRKGKNGGIFSDIDNLSYNYNGNRLNFVNDAINGNEDVGDFRNNNTGTNDYEYWNDGSLKVDRNKSISLIEYDTYLKKVKQINFANGNWVKFFYDGSGILLKRTNSLGDYWEYVGSIIHKNGVPYQMSMPEGRAVYVAGQWVYEFEYRDHLGNLRVSFKNEGGTLTQTQTNETDPFGLEIKPLSMVLVSPQNFTFNKIEKVNDFNLNVYHAFYRDSDPQIGRWWQTDSKPNPSLSLYAMMGNNPIRFADPMGDTLRINGSKSFVKQATNALAKLIQTEEGRKLFEQLNYSNQNFTIRESTVSNSTEPSSNPNKSIGRKAGDIDWNPFKYDGGMEESGDNNRPPFVGLGHEMRHSSDIENGSFSSKGFLTPDGTGLPTYEMTAVDSENKIRANIGESIRKFYTSNNGNWQGQTSQNGVGTFSNFNYSNIQSIKISGGKSYIEFLKYKMSNFPINSTSGKQYTPTNSNYSLPIIK